MNLIAEIIQDLSSDNPNLTNVLTKTKVLLHKLGQKELADSWVNKELNGYGDADDLPSYRILDAEPKCNWTSLRAHGPNQPLPIGKSLSEKEIDRLEHYKTYGSISAIEHAVSSSDTSRIQVSLPVESYHRLSEGFTSDISITNAWIEFGTHQFVGLLTEVRTRLLDFVLNLQDEFGEESTDDEIKEQAKTFDTKSMFTETVFNDSNVSIIIGDNSTQNISNIQVNKGDFDSLATALREIGIEQDDIDSLNKCIEGDGAREGQQIGDQVVGCRLAQGNVSTYH